MKLFLTSQASLTIDKLIPLLDKDPRELNVLFITTAANPYLDKPWMEADRKKLVELGFRVVDLDLNGKTKSELSNILNDVNIVFVAGGNTFYLLEKARESGFDILIKKLVDHGVWYVGSSAGSVIAGPDIEPVAIFDDPKQANLKTTKGFSLVNFVVLPHFGKPKYGANHKNIMKQFGSTYTLVPLKDTQALFIHDEQYQFIDSADIL